MGTRRRRSAAAKSSTSLLMLLVIAAAVLNFIPFNVILAAGTATGPLSSALQGLYQIRGTHLEVDSLGIFADTKLTGSLVRLLVNSTTSGTGLAGRVILASVTLATSEFWVLESTRYIAVKAQKTTVDIANANGTLGGLLQPFGSGPILQNASGNNATLELRVVYLSLTITGYNPVDKTITNRYGEDNLAGLNAAFSISLDRLFLDLFLDPEANTITYIISAEMTVYQALAMVIQGGLR